MLSRGVRLPSIIPSIPFIEPYILPISGYWDALRKTPANDEFIAAVGPPDCATAILNVPFSNITKNHPFTHDSVYFYLL